jgi:hypothetical protein
MGIIDYAYDFYAETPSGDAHFYIAQYKSNRMKEWRYIRDGEIKDVMQDVNEFQTRNKNFKGKIRVLKMDCQMYYRV